MDKAAREAAARQYIRRNRQRRRARALRRRRIAVALFILCTVFFIGYITGCGVERHTSAPDEMPTPTAAVTRVDLLDAPVPTTSPTPLPEPPEPEPVRWRDDIVTDGNLLAYDLQVVMQDAAEKYGVPYALLLAIADVESRFDPDAASSTNDHGLLQINRCNHDWLREEGIDPLTYEGNIEASARIISQHLENYGDTEKALMAYNCGATGARRLWDAGTFQTDYSRKVMAAYEHWTAVLEE